VGDALYAIPYHVCPTVALYDEALVVESGHITGRWQIEGRRRHNRF
jgi:D-serine deaminase-like pyridoxal phosphate-dependent protein